MLTEEDQAQFLSDITVSVMKKYWESFFPDEGPFARSLFPRHIEFLGNTAKYHCNTLFGANRIGKSMLLSYAASCFAMGKYPVWWPGRRFEKPVKFWIAGQTTELVKGSTQEYLFGKDGVSGMIDANHIEHIYWNQQNPGVINRVTVRSEMGGLSEVQFKTYDQGWERFQSGTVDVVIMDEEMPTRVFSEAFTRTLTTNGLVLCGFTGLKGLSPVVTHLWPDAAGIKRDESVEVENTSRSHIFIGWKDVPYSVLSEKARKDALATYLPHEIKARTEGIPSIGEGMIYPVSEDEFTVDPFEIPIHWPKAFALDPGYRLKTAGLWAAWDQDSDCIYLYSEHYKGLAEPPVHVDAMRRRGSWIPCIIDYAGANLDDGERVKIIYRDLMRAINPEWALHDAQKSFTAGRLEVYSRLTSGRLKVFSTLKDWFTEFRQYHYDEKGKIAPTPDHLMDDTRYICMGTRHFRTKPENVTKTRFREVEHFG